MTKDTNVDTGIIFLDQNKQQIVDSVENFKQRVIKNSVTDFVILGVNAKGSGFFSLLNVGDDIEKISFGLDLTKQHIIDMVMSIAEVYAGEELEEYVHYEGEEETETGSDEET